MDKNPVLQFLQRGSYTFDEGMAVLLTFSNNGGVTNFIQRRRDKKALQMELVKLAHVPRLTPLPGREMPSFLQERPAKEEKPQEKPKAPEQAPSPKKEEPLRDRVLAMAGTMSSLNVLTFSFMVLIWEKRTKYPHNRDKNVHFSHKTHLISSFFSVKGVNRLL